jgi:hypothetical protein
MAFIHSKVAREALKKMKIKIPGGEMVGKQCIHCIQRNNAWAAKILKNYRKNEYFYRHVMILIIYSTF